MSNQRIGEHYIRYNTNVVEQSNKSEYNKNDYSQVFDNKQLSVVDIDYSKQVDYLVVNSGSRDPVLFPNSCNFILDLNDEFKNISQMELIQAIIPDKNNVQTQPYLLLKIKELQNTMSSNDRNISESFAIIQLAPPTLAGTFIQCDKRINEYVKFHNKSKKPNLKRMSISVTDPLGTVFDFGANGSLDPIYQTTFVFKITTEEKNRSVLNQRSAF
jgi:Zn-dependent M16 (insulinase) family peptidase